MSQTRITKEAARDIWQAACNTKYVLTPFDTYERLSYVLQKLSKDVGEDGEPLGQFLVDDGEDEGSVEYAVEDTSLTFSPALFAKASWKAVAGESRLQRSRIARSGGCEFVQKATNVNRVNLGSLVCQLFYAIEIA